MSALFLLLLAAQAAPVPSDSLFHRRLQEERLLAADQWVLLPHRQNYFLPLTYEHLQASDTLSVEGQEVDRERAEAKFQLSVKVTLAQDLWLARDAVYFAFTLQSWWQVYNLRNSQPIRENNYEPEFLYLWATDLRVLGWTLSVLGVGLSHQSNGRAYEFSRSWNRLFGVVAVERNRWLVALRPWFRIPEPTRDSPNDLFGDENPDILRYLGHGELYLIFHPGRHEMTAMIRDNLRWPNRGALQLEWSFPVGRVHGYLQYFVGYGESLIDYNLPLGRVGLGILLTRFL